MHESGAQLEHDFWLRTCLNVRLDLVVQQDQLRTVGFEHVYSDPLSGMTNYPPELQRQVTKLRAGDAAIALAEPVRDIARSYAVSHSMILRLTGPAPAGTDD